jgi:hypothetical protein
MEKSRTEVVAESRAKGVRAGAAAATTVVLGVVGLPVAAAVGSAATAWLGWRWWKHRADNGIKF